MFKSWTKKAKELTENIYVLYGAYKHDETPWYAKVLAMVVVAYALSPIDLIPDFIPVLGYIDDVILVPIGVYMTLKLIPQCVVDEVRQNVKERRVASRGMWAGATFIISIWLLVLYQLLQGIA